MAEAYATVNDMAELWRPMTADEQTRAAALLPVVSDTLRQEAMNRGRDLDVMIATGKVLEAVVRRITVEITARELNTSTTSEPMTQMSQSALGYTVSGSYLVPGGGLFIKRAELEQLGLRRQRIGVLNVYSRN